MEGKKLLILRLEGPLQAWGSDSKWDRRDTEAFPTKSGVVGLLGCALGLERNDPELVAMTNAIRMAVRADRGGTILRDYQTVTGNPLRNAMGVPRSSGNTIIPNRYYLQDACFTVFLEMPDEWHARITSALKDPKWCVYLGRKTCVPTRPILECENPPYDSLDDALKKYPQAKRAVLPMAYETEERDDNLPTVTRPDILVEPEREFARRTIWQGSLKVVPKCI